MMTMVDGMMTACSAVRLSHTVEKGTSLPFQSEMPMFFSSRKTWPRLCTFGKAVKNYLADFSVKWGGPPLSAKLF